MEEFYKNDERNDSFEKKSFCTSLFANLMSSESLK